MRIRIASFGGVQPNTDARAIPAGAAQIAHNCLLVDGSLQPMPRWVKVGEPVYSVGPPKVGGRFTAHTGYCGVSFFGPPFGKVNVSLSDSGALQPSRMCAASATYQVAAAGLSKKAVRREYAVTALRNVGGVWYESALSLATLSGQYKVVYEGDYVTVSVSGSGQKLNIYRTTSDVTTGSGANGAVSANWQLIAQLEGDEGIYVDGGASTDTPFDTYLPRGSLAQPVIAKYMGLLAGGWMWLVSADGSVAFSDRNSWGYWPVENVYNVGAVPGTKGIVTTGAVSVGDRLYIGTQTGAFVLSAALGETGGMVAHVTAMPGAGPCINNTMVATPSGALYCSAQGVVALNPESAGLLTRGLARGVAGLLPDGTEVRFDEMANAVYHNGRYIALAGG